MLSLSIPQVSIRPSILVSYMCYQGERFRNQSSFNVLNTASKGAGLLSNKAGKNLRNAIETLCYTALLKWVYRKSDGTSYPFFVNFITLTLSRQQNVSDSEVVRICLSPFLENLVKMNPGFLYVWKAEVQDNGNIHFHITTNTFIHHSFLRKSWNYYQRKLDKGPDTTFDNPNSTDVHAVRNVGSLANYMASYLLKKDLYKRVLKRYHQLYDKYHKSTTATYCVIPRRYFQHLKRKVTCRLWSCSKILLLKPPTFYGYDENINDELRLLFVESNCAVVKDYISYVLLDKDVIKELPAIYAFYKEYYSKVIHAHSLVSHFID